MIREEQDKIWNELSEESRYHYRTEYKYRLEDSKREIEDPEEGGGDLTVLTSQIIADDLEKIFGKHNLRPGLTYEDICKKLSKEFTTVSVSYSSGKLMATKMDAIHKLLMVAKFFNINEDGSDWIPDFDDEDNEFYTLGIDPDDDSIKIIEVNINRTPTEIVYFRTKEIVEEAIQILGEDVIRTALTIKY